MKVIHARNVNEALPLGIMYLKDSHRTIAPRGGEETWEYPTPVCTVYERPWERVLFYPERDANPFFHLMESLWILDGRRDVEWLANFNARMADYSDNGKTFHAAYGYRLRRHYEVDQLEAVIRLLRREPDTRRAVMQIWDPDTDLDIESKDIPCNDTLFFKIRDGKLNLTVANRSNDILWGAYGANAVQFSMIQEYVAGMSLVEVGEYRQVSDSFHAYLGGPGGKLWERLSEDLVPAVTLDPYKYQEVSHHALVNAPFAFRKDLGVFMEGGDMGMWCNNFFFTDIACPMREAWKAYKCGDLEVAIGVLAYSMPENNDWKRACTEWLKRRQGKRNAI